ncbi:hypothetical protein J1N35_028947, partial [Gossypium stocksii]
TGVGRAKLAATPLELNNKLTSVEYDKNLQQENGEKNGDELLDDKYNLLGLAVEPVHATTQKVTLGRSIKSGEKLEEESRIRNIS